MKFNNGDQSDSDEFLDLTNDQSNKIEMNIIKNSPIKIHKENTEERNGTEFDWEQILNTINDNVESKLESKSDSYRDDVFYNEDNEIVSQMQYIDLNSICRNIQDDVKNNMSYVKSKGYLFWYRLKDEWNDLIFGDTYEYDFKGSIDDL